MTGGRQVGGSGSESDKGEHPIERLFFAWARHWCIRGALLVLTAHPVLVLSAGISVSDDVGRTILLERPAQRIVTLAPHLTELLFELGVGERIVGTVRFSDHPDEARTIPRLGDAFSLNVELLLELNPDLVIAWYSGGSSRTVNKIIGLGIPVYFNEAETLISVLDSAERIARLVGVEEAARLRGAAYMTALAQMRERYGDSTPVRIFYQMSEVNLYTVNGAHLIGQAIALCGGANVFAGAPIKVFQVGREAVVEAQPDLILFTGSDEQREAGRWSEDWRPFRQVPAVANGDLRALSADMLTRPSLRMMEGIRALCECIDDVRQGVGSR